MAKSRKFVNIRTHLFLSQLFSIVDIGAMIAFTS